MTRLKESIIGQIDAALEAYSNAKRRARYDDISDAGEMITSELIVRLSATIDRLSPAKSQYRANAFEALKKYGPDNTCNIPLLVGALKALRADYEAGHLERVEQLVEADLFADFLQMAEHLVEQGYKDAGAVLAGGVLEEHLRKLCARNGLPTDAAGRPKKAEAMNSDLASASVYSKLDQKSITAWLDLRNKAAHGKYNEYTREQVGLMLEGVREFLRRNTL